MCFSICYSASTNNTNKDVIVKVRNYIPFAKPGNQLPRDLRHLPWGEPVDGLHRGDAAVLAVCVVGFIAALFGLY